MYWLWGEDIWHVGQELHHKSFPFYDDLAIVFGKDKAIGSHATTTIEVGSEPVVEEENEDILNNQSLDFENYIPNPPFASSPIAEDFPNPPVACYQEVDPKVPRLENTTRWFGRASYF